MEEKWITWCAGFFEGEGYFSCTANEYGRKLVLGIQQCDRLPLDIFEETMEVGNVRGPYAPKFGNHNKKEYYVYVVNKIEDIKKVFSLLSPYLTSRRHEQYKIALEKYEMWEDR